jgi:hypothetical protein
MNTERNTLRLKFVLSLPRTVVSWPMIVGFALQGNLLRFSHRPGFVDVMVRDDLKVDIPKEDIFFEGLCCDKTEDMISIGHHCPFSLNDPCVKHVIGGPFNTKLCSMKCKDKDLMDLVVDSFNPCQCMRTVVSDEDQVKAKSAFEQMKAAWNSEMNPTLEG